MGMEFVFYVFDLFRSRESVSKNPLLRLNTLFLDHPISVGKLATENKLWHNTILDFSRDIKWLKNWLILIDSDKKSFTAQNVLRVTYGIPFYFRWILKQFRLRSLLRFLILQQRTSHLHNNSCFSNLCALKWCRSWHDGIGT